MTIRLGANPIGWSNDDLQETAAKPRSKPASPRQERGVAAWKTATSFPPRRCAQESSLTMGSRASAAGIRSNSSIAPAREEFDAASPHRHDEGDGRTCSSSPKRRMRSMAIARAVVPPPAAAGRLGRSRREDDRVRRMARRRGAETLLPPPYGHDRPVGRRYRRLDRPHEAARQSAARHRTCPLGRRRPPPWRAATASASAMFIARTRARRRCANPTPATGASSIDPRQGEELGVYTAPGDGVMTTSRCPGVERYSGWVVLEAEQDPKKAPSLPYARKGVAHLRAALKEAGWGDGSRVVLDVRAARGERAVRPMRRLASQSYPVY